MIAGIIIVIFVGALAGLIAWATIATIYGNTPKPLRLAFIVLLFAIGIATYFTTYHYDYYANMNTHVYGWPIPTVIFQRDNLASPWLDFVGLIFLLAFPMNFILYAILPSVTALVVRYIYSRKKADTVS